MRDASSRSATAIALILCGAAGAQLEYRPNREYRSLNTESYEIAIQKNGELDVSLSSGDRVFTDAFPMVWIEGDKTPRPMTIDGTWSSRTEIRDPLGDGNGMTLRKDECTWTLRSYPTKPFMAVQVVFENTTKKPVMIRALLPWCAGEPRRGALHLGTNTEMTVVRTSSIALPHTTDRGERIGSRNVAMFNPQSGRMLITGFLTHRSEHGFFEWRLAEPDKEPDFYRFQAICEFEPPIRLEPGEALESDVLYLGLFDRHPVVGLERYIRAAQAANELRVREGEPAHLWIRGTAPMDGFSDVSPNAEALHASRPAAPIDLFESDPPAVWAWTTGDSSLPGLMLVQNDSDDLVTKGIAISLTGVGQADYYDLFDLGHEEFAGVVPAVAGIELKPREDRLFSVIPHRNTPQIIAVSPGGSGLTSTRWDGTALHGTLAVDAIEDQTVHILVPQVFESGDVVSSSGSIAVEMAGDVLSVTVMPELSGTIDLTVSFARRE